ncbi:MAG: hypothetical protein RL643_1048 [Actinomycetota bacterium]|jgi:hypothetical protein
MSISEVQHHVRSPDTRQDQSPSPDATRQDQSPSPDAKRLRLHHSLQKNIGAAVADDLMEFLPPSGWGDLVRRSDLEAVERRLDARIDALGARLDARIDALGERLDARIDALEVRIDGLERQLVQLRDEVRALGNLRTTIVLTGASLGISLFVGLGGLMVAIVQLTSG